MSTSATPQPERIAAPAFDYVLVGGGLHNGLLALALLNANPSASLCIVERDERIGGNHTWSVHEVDVPRAARSWFDALVVAHHDGYDVRFPGTSRVLNEPYLAIKSERLHQLVSDAVERAPNAAIARCSATAVTPHTVTCDDGRTLSARLVVDARGPGRCGTEAQHFQKFVGLELVVEPSTVPLRPTLMDATVPQRDGFRFVYLLPLGPGRVLVEDTYYSDNPRLDTGRLDAEVLHYAQQRGLVVKSVARRESGVLPLPLRRPSIASQGALVAGYGGGFFHPTTGYSFPFALRLALHIAGRPPERVRDESFREFSDELGRQQRFACWLNRLLFAAFAPEQRYAVLERFYDLPTDTIRRFYSLQTTGLDRTRILCGRPPRGFSLRRLMTAPPSPIAQGNAP